MAGRGEASSMKDGYLAAPSPGPRLSAYGKSESGSGHFDRHLVDLSSRVTGACVDA